MKRYILALLLLWYCIVSLGNIKTVTLNYNADEFNINPHNNESYISPTNHLYYFESDTTTPELPIIPIKVYIDKNKDYQNFTWEATEVLIEDSIHIRHNTIEHPTMGSYPNNYSPIEYEEERYPQINIEYSGTHIMDGNKLLSFCVCPFRYDATNDKLYLLTDIELNIILKESSTTIQPTANRMRNMVKSLVVNPNDVASSTTNNIDYEYIIVTNEHLKGAFQKLADWKTTKGVKSKVLTIEYINNQYSGETIQLKIKKALKNYYNGAAYHGLKYVLLGGDTDIIPTQLCHVEYNGSQEETPADIYYGSFDNTLNWDSDDDGIYGERSDDIDYIPEIIVTRLPVDTNTNLTTAIIERIINYEKRPDTTDWKNNILMAGAGDIGKERASIVGTTTYDVVIKPYWNKDRFRLYDDCSDGDLGEVYDCTPENLNKELAKGYTIVNVDCHGIETSWSLEKFQYDLTFTNQYTNKGNSIIMTTACYTNAFDEVSLSERFIRSRNSGILSYLGSSRQGWSKSSVDYNRMVYLKFLDTTSVNYAKLAESLHTIKSAFSIVTKYSNSPLRWLHFSLNLLGDPEMPIYLECPQTFDNVLVTMKDDTLHINTGITGCNICVSSADGSQNTFILKENVQTTDITNISEECNLCISKIGYIPYIVKVGDTVYIQNEKLSGNNTYHTNKVYIGSDVTNTKEKGNVVIDNGKTIVQSENGVTITKNFTIKEDAIFEIKSGTN